jgi:hypothetical protein
VQDVSIVIMISILLNEPDFISAVFLSTKSFEAGGGTIQSVFLPLESNANHCNGRENACFLLLKTSCQEEI